MGIPFTDVISSDSEGEELSYAVPKPPHAPPDPYKPLSATGAPLVVVVEREGQRCQMFGSF